MGLAEFTLSRRVPGYVAKAKAVMANEKARKAGECPAEVEAVLDQIRTIPGFEGLKDESVDLSSTIYAVKPGDGSAREQAASCQRVLLGGAIAVLRWVRVLSAVCLWSSFRRICFLCFRKRPYARPRTDTAERSVKRFRSQESGSSDYFSVSFFAMRTTRVALISSWRRVTRPSFRRPLSIAFKSPLQPGIVRSLPAAAFFAASGMAYLPPL